MENTRVHEQILLNAMYHRHMQHSYSLFWRTEIENNFGSAIASHVKHSIIKLELN